MPDALTTTPVPHASSITPMSEALNHPARVGAGTPRARTTAYRINPAMRNWLPIINSGGSVSIANRIAR